MIISIIILYCNNNNYYAFVGMVSCLSTIGGYFIQLLVLWGHVFCPLSGGRSLSVSRRLKMYCYGRVNRGHIACPLYGGCPYLRVSVMRGSTVCHRVKFFDCEKFFQIYGPQINPISLITTYTTCSIVHCLLHWQYTCTGCLCWVYLSQHVQ